MQRLWVAAAIICASGCGGGEPAKNEGGLGAAVAGAGHDTGLVSAAQGKVNEVVRNATDCAVAKAAMPKAREALDEADAVVQTPTGRTILGTLRKQLENVENLCP